MTNSTGKAVTVFVVVSFVVAIGTYAVSFKYYEKRFEIDMTDVDPEGFPVVLVRPTSAEIVRLDSQGKVDLEASDASLLIPAGQEELVRSRLEDWLNTNWRKGIPYLTVSSLEERRQLIDLDISIDGFYETRYEVTDRQVKPLMFKRAGPLFVFLPMIPALIALIAFVVLALFARWFLVKRKLLQFT